MINNRYDTKVVYKSSPGRYGETTCWRDFFDFTFGDVIKQVEREFTKREGEEIIRFELKVIKR